MSFCYCIQGNTQVRSLDSMYGFRNVKLDGARSAQWTLEGLFSLE
jgi:hypothetical protein